MSEVFVYCGLAQASPQEGSAETARCGAYPNVFHFALIGYGGAQTKLRPFVSRGPRVSLERTNTQT